MHVTIIKHLFPYKVCTCSSPITFGSFFEYVIIIILNLTWTDKADFGCTEQDKETLKYINSSDKEQRLVNIDKILLEAEDLKEITQQGTWLKQDVSTLIVNCHIST